MEITGEEKNDRDEKLNSNLPTVTSHDQERTNAGTVISEGVKKHLSICSNNSSNISFDEVPLLHPKGPEEMWDIVKCTCEDEKLTVEPTKHRKGWRTVRIFVSSTFKDFHQEREVLVKEVFPDLRLWCEQRKLRLVECDLRWGVPKDSTSEETIRICLEELDRCYEDNVAPFFLNLAGERTGWIPSFGDLTYNLAAQYGWVYGLSVTEMEIVHGAFRKLNPNALFMIRQAENLETIPDSLKDDFIDCNLFCVSKLRMLKDTIKSFFPPSNVIPYSVKAYEKESGEIDFDGIRGTESLFSQKVYDFFKSRIEMLYPLDPSPGDPIQVQREAHETFMDTRSRCVLGRIDILEQVTEYLLSDISRAPLVLTGRAGAGKSAIIAKLAYDTLIMAKEEKIPRLDGFNKWRVFFHFVGATPGSTDLAFFLQRLTKEINPGLKDAVSDLESLIQLSGSLLSNPNTEPVVIFIDAINQIDEDKQHFLNRWLPEGLSANVRVVLSTIEGSRSHLTLRACKTLPKEIVCGPLDIDSRKAIVKNILSIYSKRLDKDQMEALVQKNGSSNPLWLTLACEELRVFGLFSMVSEKIHSLSDDLISLEIDVFSRFEEEAGGDLVVATLCLLEVSRHGLLETELLALLGDKANVAIPQYIKDKEDCIAVKTEETLMKEGAQIDAQVESVDQPADNLEKRADDICIRADGNEEDGPKKTVFRPKGKRINFLPAREWAVIYRNLKQLLRPCGDLGEGRLDFYHRSLSKAVQKRYFCGTDEYKHLTHNFWHGVLASYFENVDDMDRKAEELPYHLEQLEDTNRLRKCLLEWPVFDRLFSEDFSVDLLHSWQKAGGYPVAATMYKDSLVALRESGVDLADYADQMEKVIIFLIQAGQYSDALEILKERRELEESTLGSRAADLADIFQLMAKCKSEVVKSHNFLTKDQLKEDLEVITYCRLSLTYRKQLTGEEHEFKLAMTNISIAHHLGIVADITRKQEYRTEAFECIDYAIDTFKKINDIGHLAEAIMTKSFLNPRLPRHFEEKRKQLMLAKDLCMKAYGENHLLACRLYVNIGILYEDIRDYQKAYDYFVKWHDVCMHVLGADHPKTARAKETLDEKTYVEIRQARERLAAGTA